jgi:hypothetical protein
VKRRRRRRRRLFTLYQSTQEESSSSSSTAPPTEDRVTIKLEAKQLDFDLGHLNQHHEDTFKKFTAAYSPLGQEMAKMNTWSGGSMSLEVVVAIMVHVVLGVDLHRQFKIRNSKSQPPPTTAKHTATVFETLTMNSKR